MTPTLQVSFRIALNQRRKPAIILKLHRSILQLFIIKIACSAILHQSLHLSITTFPTAIQPLHQIVKRSLCSIIWLTPWWRVTLKRTWLCHWVPNRLFLVVLHIVTFLGLLLHWFVSRHISTYILLELLLLLFSAAKLAEQPLFLFPLSQQMCPLELFDL